MYLNIFYFVCLPVTHFYVFPKNWAKLSKCLHH